MKNTIIILILLIVSSVFANEKANLDNAEANQIYENGSSLQVGHFDSMDIRDANPPSNLTISILNSILVLSWTDVPNATGYKVEASNSPTNGFTDVSSSGSFTHQGSTENWSASTTTFSRFYRVRTVTASTPNTFVLVQGGTFNNGTADVTVSSFYIDKYELTQAKYLAVMGTNPSQYTSVVNGPVERVTWFKAVEYCNRSSMLEGLTPCYSYSVYGTNPANWPAGWNSIVNNHVNFTCDWSSNGYRLPTEMEWMYAARGGNLTHGYTYSGSNTVGDVAWYSGNNTPNGTKPVGSKLPNELGIYDMSGNVFEWCWDMYTTYPTFATTDPIGASSGWYRVERGGGAGDFVSWVTVAFRNACYATWSDASTGLRLCKKAQ